MRPRKHLIANALFAKASSRACTNEKCNQQFLFSLSGATVPELNSNSRLCPEHCFHKQSHRQTKKRELSQHPRSFFVEVFHYCFSSSSLEIFLLFLKPLSPQRTAQLSFGLSPRETKYCLWFQRELSNSIPFKID